MKSIRFHYQPLLLTEEMRRALVMIAEDFPIHASLPSRTDITVEFFISGQVPRFQYSGRRASITGATIGQVLRMLATLRGFLETGIAPAVYEETPRFDTMGLMLDASRNAVPTVKTVQFFLRRMALMGLNLFMLYTEDTYEVPEEPFIGYLRGRYSQEELRCLDDYADALGIEMVPCIQALGHLAQILRWPAYEEVRDTNDILMVGEKKTYLLLDRMLRAASAPYRSKRIHIGMDEAHDLGLGKYLARHGFQPRFQIMSEHLRRVVAITKRLGLRPMIWGDMYFRISSKTGDYLDEKTKIPAKVAQSIPQSVQLMYWDYYHAEKEFYLEWIDRHRALGKEPVFSAGLWTWLGFWHNFTKTRLTADAGLLACKERGVREVLTTAWGDDGNEVDMRSMLPGLQHFAEHGYADTVSDAQLARQICGSTGEKINTWLLPGKLDETPYIEPMLEHYKKHQMPITPYLRTVAPGHLANWLHANPSKWLLWQDPLLGLYDAQLEGVPLQRYYARLVRELRAAGTGSASELFAMPIRLAEILEDKAEMGLRLLHAYQRGDRRALAHWRDRTIPRASRKLSLLHEAHRKLWFHLYKPNGWEVLDARYGALAARLVSSGKRVDDFLNGRVDTLAELDEPRSAVMPWPKGTIGFGGTISRRMTTPSTLT